ncbi:MAG TPA: gliding motility lipoprotein GldH [Flavobacteriaceae bacterium]|nr:gliding motility lipoprotein GldH [Flavobacteriaceae bacterium]
MRNFIGILIFLIFISCSKNDVYNQYKPINNNAWEASKTIKFIVENTDTISQKNVFINIRNNKNYAFSSLFLIAKIKFPNGTKIIDTLEYEMTNAEGEWLGSGFTDIKENKLLYKENVTLNQLGNYQIQINHATRSMDDVNGENSLQGITDVGLSIEKIKE